MVYFEFLDKISKHLKSLRVLKNYVSFDMIFPITWSLPKTVGEEIQLVKDKTDLDGVQYNVLSFVTENKRENIDKVEMAIDFVVKKNVEREEKEKLFQNKVEELKSIFEKQELDKLTSLKFDMSENNFENVFKDEGNTEPESDSEGTELIKNRTEEVSS